MLMNGVNRNDLKSLVEKELTASKNEREEKFPSFYHGYLVLKEEIEEATEEADILKCEEEITWKSIRENRTSHLKYDIENLKMTAENTALECIQVLAMIEKLKEVGKYGL